MEKAKQIISDALRAYPVDLVDALDAQALQSFSDSIPHRPMARPGALARFNACNRAKGWLVNGDIELLLADCAAMIVALHEAAKLLGISRLDRNIAAAQWDEAQAKQALVERALVAPERLLGLESGI